MRATNFAPENSSDFVWARRLRERILQELPEAGHVTEHVGKCRHESIRTKMLLF